MRGARQIQLPDKEGIAVVEAIVRARIIKLLFPVGSRYPVAVAAAAERASGGSFAVVVAELLEFRIVSIHVPLISFRIVTGIFSAIVSFHGPPLPDHRL